MNVIVIAICVTLVLLVALFYFGQAAETQAQANLAQQQGAGGQIGDAFAGLGKAFSGLFGGKGGGLAAAF